MSSWHALTGVVLKNVPIRDLPGKEPTKLPQRRELFEVQKAEIP
jgi:hypothetical protein